MIKLKDLLLENLDEPMNVLIGAIFPNGEIQSKFRPVEDSRHNYEWRTNPDIIRWKYIPMFHMLSWSNFPNNEQDKAVRDYLISKNKDFTVMKVMGNSDYSINKRNPRSIDEKTDHDNELIQKVVSRINTGDRIIMAKKDILPLSFPVEQYPKANHKPNGLWYAVGTEWIDWVQSEMPDWMGHTFYKIEVNTSNILHLKSGIDIDNFTKKYVKFNSIGYDSWEKNANIYWKPVAEEYSGIEISPYQYNSRHKYMWYYGWDVASGCIWDKSGISKIEKITV